MDWNVVIMSLVIVIARIADVSLGTLRTVWVIKGWRVRSFFIGFIEILIWVLVVGKVIQNLDSNLIYPICYAIGFALGTFLGVTIEGHLAMGDQVVRIFTRNGDAVTKALRDATFGVTVFNGEGRDGPIQLLFIKTPRRRSREVERLGREIDPGSFCVIDDIRFAGTLHPIAQTTGWRTVLKKK